MIPKKAGTDTNLDEQIEKDLEKAQKQQQEKIKSNKPKLAQAIGSKYLKYVIILSTAGVIGYKMFFAPTPEEPKKKKTTKNKIAKSNNKTEEQQKQLASTSLGKTAKSSIVKDKTDAQSVISLDAQTISNSQTLKAVAVPELKLPEVPALPTVDKIVIKEVKEEKLPVEVKKEKTDQNIDKQKTNQKKNTENETKKKNDKEEQKSKDKKTNEKQDVVEEQKDKKTKKVKKKIRDQNGRIKTVSVEVEVDENGNIIQEVGETNKNNNEIMLGSPLSAHLPTNTKDEVDNVNKKTKSDVNVGIAKKSLEQMFVLNGKGASSSDKKRSAGTSAKDFILFDGASISEKEISTTNQTDANVSKISNMENTIVSGKVMEAVLETAINSESAGTIRAVMSKDVFGESGSKILIPRGSRLYGSYATTSTTTQTRLLLTWTKVVRPDGVVIAMEADTYDQSGKKGIEGDIDTRYGELFKNSLLYSFVTLGTAIAVEKIAGIKGTTSIVSGSGTSVTNSSPANAAATSVIDTAQDIAEKMTDGFTDDLNPVISIPQGTLLKIISSMDIVIPSAYKRRTKDINLD